MQKRAQIIPPPTTTTSKKHKHFLLKFHIDKMNFVFYLTEIVWFLCVFLNVFLLTQRFVLQMH